MQDRAEERKRLAAERKLGLTAGDTAHERKPADEISLLRIWIEHATSAADQSLRFRKTYRDGCRAELSAWIFKAG